MHTLQNEPSTELQMLSRAIAYGEWMASVSGRATCVAGDLVYGAIRVLREIASRRCTDFPVSYSSLMVLQCEIEQIVLREIATEWRNIGLPLWRPPMLRWNNNVETIVTAYYISHCDVDNTCSGGLRCLVAGLLAAQGECVHFLSSSGKFACESMAISCVNRAPVMTSKVKPKSVREIYESAEACENGVRVAPYPNCFVPNLGAVLLAMYGETRHEPITLMNLLHGVRRALCDSDINRQGSVPLRSEWDLLEMLTDDGESVDRLGPLCVTEDAMSALSDAAFAASEWGLAYVPLELCVICCHMAMGTVEVTVEDISKCVSGACKVDLCEDAVVDVIDRIRMGRSLTSNEVLSELLFGKAPFKIRQLLKWIWCATRRKGVSNE